MSRIVINNVISVFLLTVFSINTLSGFACSIGIDMRYNSIHHESIETDHCSGTNNEKLSIIHSSEEFLFSSNNEDCCVSQVAKNILLDKSINYFVPLKSPCIFFTNTFESYSNIKNASDFITSRMHSEFERRSWVPYDTNIRIAIRSFQI